jgi:TonB-linked SusC/RagA family outer membrane protein
MVPSQSDSVRTGASPDTFSRRLVKFPYYSTPANLTAASTDVVYNKDLIKSPVTSPYSAIVGRLAGMNFGQSSGQPLQDAAGFQLHGRTPIVLIDGVARNLNTIDLEEIESITILKDAVSTAMLGVRGANGALSIVTKKGTIAKSTISLTVQNGTQKGLGLVKPLSAYDYALLKNEAIDNEFKTNPTFNGVKYSPADLQAYQAGGDSVHPNVNWQNQLFNKTAPITRYNLSANGGNSFSRYYVSLEHLTQNGFLKTDDANNYSTNNFLKSYSVRTNIDLNLSPKLTAGISLFGRVINTNEPGGNGGGINDIYSGIINTPNNAYPVYNKNGSFYGNSNFLTNLQAQSTGAGYLANYTRDILTDLYVKRTLDELVKGLWVKARVSYTSTASELFDRGKNIVVYQSNGSGGYNQFGTIVLQRNNNSVTSQGRTNYAELSAGYSHTFEQKHGVDVLLLANRDNSQFNGDLPYTFSGTSGRLSYNYNRKYVIEAAFGYNGSNRYPDGKNQTRYGFFPSAGAAWNITNEKFAENLKWLSTLKLYGSYGKTGWDNPGYFSYLQRYNNNSNVFFGTSSTSNGTLVQSTLANTDITWEKAYKLTFGLQGSLIKNKLAFTAEYYHNKYSDLLQQRGRTTGILGTNYPNENIGENLYKGYDFQLSWQDTKRSLTYFISANATVQKSEVLYADEVIQPYDYMKRTGNRVGRGFGYVADGLFQTQAEINGAATILGYKPQPGDIRYKDLNGDGFINQFDQKAIGTDKPFMAYGINLGFSVKGFDFSALLQGVANRDIYLPSNGNAFFPFQNGGLGQAYENNLNRWTPANPTASEPRASIGSNTNNQTFSSYWLRKGDFMRLKNLEIGYTLPANLVAKTPLESVRLFANGLNLVTWSGLEGDRDPEVFGTYPIQRVVNFGINIKL